MSNHCPLSLQNLHHLCSAGTCDVCMKARSTPPAPREDDLMELVEAYVQIVYEYNLPPWDGKPRNNPRLSDVKQARDNVKSAVDVLRVSLATARGERDKYRELANSYSQLAGANLDALEDAQASHAAIDAARTPDALAVLPPMLSPMPTEAEHYAALKAEWSRIDAALLKMCPCNGPVCLPTPDPELQRYVLQDEDGEAFINTNDPVEVITKLYALWCEAVEWNEEFGRQAREQSSALQVTPDAQAVSDTQLVDFIETSGHAVLCWNFDGVVNNGWTIGDHDFDDIAKGQTWRDTVAAALAARGGAAL